MKKYESGIDFNIINFYGIDYIKVLIDSIHKYTDLDYTIYIINNGDNKSIETIETKTSSILFRMYFEPYCMSLLK